MILSYSAYFVMCSCENRCLDLIQEFDQGPDGALGDLSIVIRKRKFCQYNHSWVEKVSQLENKNGYCNDLEEDLFGCQEDATKTDLEDTVTLLGSTRVLQLAKYPDGLP